MATKCITSQSTKNNVLTETTPLLGDPDGPDEEIEVMDKSRLWVLPALAIGCFLSAADQTIILSSYGQIGSELDALDKTSWLATAYLLPLSSFQILYGRLSDIFGRRNLLIFAYATFGLGSLFCGLAQTMNQLIAARAIAGVGGGGFNTLATIVLADIVPLRRRGTFQGYRDLIFAVGLGVGSLGGFITEILGWRWSFLLQIPLIVAGIVNTIVSFGKDSSTKKQGWTHKLKRIDFSGAFLIISAVSTLLVGVEQVSREGWNSALATGCLAASLILFIAFFHVEMNVAVEPFSPKRVLFAPTVGCCILSGFFIYGSWMSLLYQLPLYWQAVEGKSPSIASLRLLPGFFPAVLGSLLAGLVFQSSGRYYWLTIIASSSMNIALIIIIMCTGWVTHSNVGVMVGLGICGFFLNTAAISNLLALSMGALPAMCCAISIPLGLSYSKEEDLATAISSLHLFRSLGTSICLALTAAEVQNALSSELRLQLTGEDPDSIDNIITRISKSLGNIEDLGPELEKVVRGAYEIAIDRSLFVCFCFAALALLANLPIREKRRGESTKS